MVGTARSDRQKQFQSPERRLDTAPVEEDVAKANDLKTWAWESTPLMVSHPAWPNMPELIVGNNDVRGRGETHTLHSE